MKKLILFTLVMVALRISGQNPDPGDYVPVPTPIWSMPVNHTGQEHHFICYDSKTGLESTIEPIHYAENPNQKNCVPYIPPDLAVANEETDDDDNFTSMQLIENPSVYHYSTCVKLLFTFPDGTNWQGSGSLIGPCMVITAGHCVYDNNHGGWATSMTVIPGYHNNNRPFGQASKYRLYSWKGWTESRNFDWDMGVIQLDRPLGKQAGALGYGYTSDDNFFRNNTFHNLSYPAESPYNGEQMFYCYGNFDQVFTHCLYYNKLSYGGSSGSGTYYKDGSGNRYVYAVHSHTNTNGQSGQTRITSDQFSYINQIMNDGCHSHGIEDHVTKGYLNFSVYPNPAIDKLNIHLEEYHQMCNISIVDLLGNTIFQLSDSILKEDMTIPIGNIRPGYYFVVLRDGQKIATRSFIKTAAN